MEIRKMTSDFERQVFNDCLLKARSQKGFGFRETPRSCLGASHLKFGNVYAVFEDKGAPPESMVGGFIMHDLASLPQSFGEPSLGHLTPSLVFEGSDLWSLSKGAGYFAARASAAVAGALRAEAILVYPIVRPVDLASFYSRFNFEPACEPIRNQYGETLDGEELWVQPLILQGQRLAEFVRWGAELLYQPNVGQESFDLRAS